VPPSRRDAFDQIQHLGPERLGILEQQGDGSLAREALDEGEEARADVVDERGFVAPRFVESQQRLETIHRAGVRTRRTHALDELPQTLHGNVDRVVVADAGDLPHDGRGGGERGAVRAEVAAPDEHRSLGVQPGQELRGEPGLADPGLADHGEQERSRRGDHA